MAYLDPDLADRINRKVDELNARISRASEIQAQAKARLEREQGEREIARRERRTAIQADAAELYQKWGSAPPIPVSDETSSFEPLQAPRAQGHAKASPSGKSVLRDAPDEIA